MVFPRHHHNVCTNRWLIFRELNSFRSGRASSIAIILGGSIAYTWVKHLESQGSSEPKHTKERPQYERVALEEVEAGRGGKPE